MNLAAKLAGGAPDGTPNPLPFTRFIATKNQKDYWESVTIASNPIFILGMHRSGTSCLTGHLQEAGLFLGNVKTKSGHNAKGNRENPAVMVLNEALLQANGGAWNTLPGSPLVWTKQHALQRDAILDEYSDDRAWGMKDPRFLLTLPFWLEAIGTVRTVGSFRHPLAVARSLNARNNIPISAGLSLWTDYNRLLLDRVRSGGLPIVSFDQSPDAYLASVCKIVNHLELSPPANGFEFFEQNLRHQTGAGNEPLPEEVEEIYAALRSNAV